MRSEAYPPNDPWMAGYAISYYYFGYVITAMLAMLSGTTSTIAFNLMIAMIFALTGLTAFGVVANLVRSTRLGRSAWAPILTGLLGCVFVVLLGNYQVPAIEIPYNTGTATESYLRAIDSEERQQPRTVSAGDLTEWDYWWFFRSARVLNDRNLDGSRTEVIDEFPAFSFILADVHPHVLALPFAVLALGLAANVALSGIRPRAPQILLYGTVVGSLIFLNTWDGPIYLIIVAGAEALRRSMTNGRGRLRWPDLRATLGFALAVAVTAVVIFLPFLLSFRSQLGGILPNIIHPTSFVQFFIMFGPLLILLVGFLAVEAWRAGPRMNWKLGIQIGLIALALGLLAVIAMTLLALLVPELRGTVLGFVDQNGGLGQVIPEILSKRLTHIVTALVLAAGLIVVVARLFPRHLPVENPVDESERYVVRYPPATGFALLLVGAGIVLTLTPEFAYLRDNFGTRMNTVFKFYYQAWILWSVAAAYGCYAVLGLAQERTANPVVKATFGAVSAAAISAGLLFVVLGVHYRTQIETGRVTNSPFAGPLTLDGGRSITTEDDYAATLCLGAFVQGDDVVVVSRVGGSYDIGVAPTGLTGRIVGLPNLINWPGHQSQWRGSTYSAIAGSREFDVDRLYADQTWRTAQDIIAQYGIDFIFFGQSERQRYGPDADLKFRDRLPIVCEVGESRFYQVTPDVLAAAESATQ
jgi:YYY domain-containing protein